MVGLTIMYNYRKIVKKFDEAEVVTNIERPVHHRFTFQNIAIVSESVAQDPTV